tara:strand:- start:11627 stop:17230 length:5604 start_codon:yes stop_codon:yes gene_type:complete
MAQTGTTYKYTFGPPAASAAFKSIALSAGSGYVVGGQTIADSHVDVLTLSAGENIALISNPAGDVIGISARDTVGILGDSVYYTVHANSGSWESTFYTVSTLSANWYDMWPNLTTVYANVSSNSAKWENVYSSVNSNSGSWTSTYQSVCTLSSDFWQNVYTTVNSVSTVFWHGTYSTVKANSGLWDHVFQTVKANSATWNESTGTKSTVNAISGETKSAFQTLRDLSGEWESTFQNVSSLSGSTWGIDIKEADGTPSVTNIKTIVVSNGSLTNDGNGQVTIATGTGGADISGADAAFKYIALGSDSGHTWGTNTMTADAAADTLTLVGGANVELRTDATSDTLRISVPGMSAVRDTVNLLSGEWESTYETVNGLSGEWESAYQTQNALSGEWESTYKTVNALSSYQWQGTYSLVKATSGEWDSTYHNVKDLSGEWESTFDHVKALSSYQWQGTYSLVGTNSSDWESTHTTLYNNSANYLSGHWGYASDGSGVHNLNSGNIGINENKPSHQLTVDGSISAHSDIAMGGNHHIVDSRTITNIHTGPSLRFDYTPSTSYVNISGTQTYQNILCGGGGGTISVWVHMLSGRGEEAYILQKGNGWSLSYDKCTHDACRFKFSQQFSAASGTWVTASTGVPLTGWSHLAVTYNSVATANNPIIYVNGLSALITETAEPDGVAFNDSISALWVGNSDLGNKPYTGEISEIKLYNRSLLPWEIRDLYSGRVTDYSDLSGTGELLTGATLYPEVGRRYRILSGGKGDTSWGSMGATTSATNTEFICVSSVNLNSGLIKAIGCVGHWTPNTIAGAGEQWLDTSGNQNHGSIVNAAQLNQPTFGGFVGIGTTTPEQALTVNGNISSSQVIYASAGDSSSEDWWSAYATLCAISAASFITVNNDPTLPGERSLSANNYITITDNGANGNIVLGCSAVGVVSADIINAAAFNTSDGVLTLTRRDGGTVTTDLDGRYGPIGAQYLTLANDSTLTNERAAAAGYGIQFTDAGANSTLTFTANDIATLAALSANWNTAYDNMVTAASFNTGTGVLTLTQQDAGTVTVDLDDRYVENGSNVGAGGVGVFHQKNSNNLEFKKLVGAGSLVVTDKTTYIELSAGAGGSASSTPSGAPTNAQYVTLDLNNELTQERVLAVSSGLGMTDYGADGNVTLVNTSSSIGSFSLIDLDTVTTVQSYSLDDSITIEGSDGINVRGDYGTHMDISFTKFSQLTSVFTTVKAYSGDWATGGAPGFWTEQATYLHPATATHKVSVGTSEEPIHELSVKGSVSATGSAYIDSVSENNALSGSILAWNPTSSKVEQLDMKVAANQLITNVFGITGFDGETEVLVGQVELTQPSNPANIDYFPTPTCQCVDSERHMPGMYRVRYVEGSYDINDVLFTELIDGYATSIYIYGNDEQGALDGGNIVDKDTTPTYTGVFYEATEVAAKSATKAGGAGVSYATFHHNGQSKIGISVYDGGLYSNNGTTSKNPTYDLYYVFKCGLLELVPKGVTGPVNMDAPGNKIGYGSMLFNDGGCFGGARNVIYNETHQNISIGPSEYTDNKSLTAWYTPLNGLDVAYGLSVGYKWGPVKGPADAQDKTYGLIVRGESGFGLSAPSYDVHAESFIKGNSGVYAGNLEVGEYPTKYNSVNVGAGSDPLWLNCCNTNHVIAAKGGGNFGVGAFVDPYPQSRFAVAGNATIGSDWGAVSAAPTNGLLVQTKAGIGTGQPMNTLDVAGNAIIGSWAGTESAPSNGLLVEGSVGVGTTALGGHKATFAGSVSAGNYITRTGNFGTSTSITYNFATDAQCVKVTTGGGLTVATSNMAPGRTAAIFVHATGAGSLSFSGWSWVGQKPIRMLANTTALLTLMCIGTSNSDVIASWSNSD